VATVNKGRDRIRRTNVTAYGVRSHHTSSMEAYAEDQQTYHI
jgi:hypothetical protein